MLVLTRKLGQRVVIAGAIEVAVAEIRGNYVKLVVDAPRVISVHRHEVSEKMRKEKEDELLTRIAESNRRNEESARELGITMDTAWEDGLNDLEEGA